LCDSYREILVYTINRSEMVKFTFIDGKMILFTTNIYRLSKEGVNIMSDANV